AKAIAAPGTLIGARIARVQPAAGRSRRTNPPLRSDAAASRTRLCSRGWVGAPARATAAAIAEHDDARSGSRAGLLDFTHLPREAMAHVRLPRRVARLGVGRARRSRRRLAELDVLRLDDVRGLLAIRAPDGIRD